MRLKPAIGRNGSAGQGSVEHGPLTPPGLQAVLREYASSDQEKLVAMYLEFEPKGRCQGLPPHSESLIRGWLDRLHETGAIFFVIETGKRIIGHAMLYPSLKNTAEFVIFVHQDFHGLGLGKKLLLGVLNYACKRLHLSKVWLSVQGANFQAISLFKKAGFQSDGCDELLRWELEMERPLNCAPCLETDCAIFGESLPFTHGTSLSPV